MAKVKSTDSGRLRIVGTALLSGAMLSITSPALIAGEAPPSTSRLSAPPSDAFTFAPRPTVAGSPGAATVATDTVRTAADRHYELTFKQLGAKYPLALRGIDGRNGVMFSVRADEVVTAARVNLEYSYSPALLPNLSQINVMINEQTIASLPVPTDEAGTLQQASVEIPPHLLGDFNRANVQLIGHYTLECEDPMHTSLWAIVNNESTLDFTVRPLRLENDLSLLPLPFFDRRSFGKLSLPMVFSRNLSLPKWEAAGALASWFGSLANFRGAEFPVHLDSVPEKGNAIVMAVRGDRIAGLTLPEVQAPTVQMMDNPSDPYGKLLVIMAPDQEGLIMAARGLALGNQVLSGPSATIARLVDESPRMPYDAPNWLPSNRPVSFGELVPLQNLTVRGYMPAPVQIPLQVPPDLFGWRSRGIPVDLTYRYTPRAFRDQSTLNVNVGDLFVRSMPIPSANEGASSTAERLLRDVVLDPSEASTAKFHVPLSMVPSNTELRFQYHYEIIKEGLCRTVPLDNVEGTIDPDSTVDISGFKHYLEMPHLGAFASAGFPFTRMADFSETIVVVPNQPDTDVMQAYLDLMGKLGDVTGYPAVRLRVRTGADTSELAGNDLLVLAAGRDQPLLSTWADQMPFQFGTSGNSFELANPPGGFFSNLFSRVSDSEDHRRIELVVRGAETQALVAGFESPLTPKRSVVVLASTSPANLREAITALVDTETNLDAEVYGSFAVIKTEGRAEVLVNRQSYSVGDLGWWLGTRYYLSSYPLALVGIALAGIVLLALIAFLLLRARARHRLEKA